MSDVIDQVVKVILALSALTAGGGLLRWVLLPPERRRLRADTDSVVVGGAEKAVLSLEKALEHANQQIERLERRDEAKDRRIDALEAALRTAGIPIPNSD